MSERDIGSVSDQTNITALSEEGGVNESSSGVHGQQMSPLRGVLGSAPASTSPPAENAVMTNRFSGVPS